MYKFDMFMTIILQESYVVAHVMDVLAGPYWLHY